MQALVKHPETGEPLGLAEVRACTSLDHAPRVAVAVVHWVTGPTDKCRTCAAKLLAIAQVLGTHVVTEAIKYPEVEALLASGQRRGMAMEVPR